MMKAVATRSSFRDACFCVFVLLILVCAATIPALAQSTASLTGIVTDASGAAVPNAKVTVTNKATGVSFNTQTDSAGAYLIPSLPIGVYDIEVTASGFQKAVVGDLDLPVATSVTRNVQLKIGETSVTVEITADAVILDTSTNSMGQVINDKYVQDIPLNGRHFTDLSLLTPGTITPPANGFLSFPLRGQGSFGINTAGQREDTTNWLVNGINLNDPVQNQITFQPPIGTLAEFKIDNSAFPAEYGRNSGAIVNMATRSGTNDFHGEAFEFLRNNALDARNFFNTVPNPQAPFKRNEFGGAFGGPLKKNKAFVFLAYEGLRQHQSLTVTSTVPSQNQIAAVTAPAVAGLITLLPPANFHRTSDASAAQADWTGFTGGALANVSLNQGSADFDVDLRAQDRLHGYYVEAVLSPKVDVKVCRSLVQRDVGKRTTRETCPVSLSGGCVRGSMEVSRGEKRDKASYRRRGNGRYLVLAWYRAGDGQALVLSQTLIGEKNESLVLFEGTAKGAAKLVALERGLGVRHGVKKVARIESVVAKELKGFAVKIVRSGARGHIDDGAGISSVLRGKSGVIDLEFRERADGRLKSDLVLYRIV